MNSVRDGRKDIWAATIHLNGDRKGFGPPVSRGPRDDLFHVSPRTCRGDAWEGSRFPGRLPRVLRWVSPAGGLGMAFISLLCTLRATTVEHFHCIEYNRSSWIESAFRSTLPTQIALVVSARLTCIYARRLGHACSHRSHCHFYHHRPKVVMGHHHNCWHLCHF